MTINAWFFRLLRLHLAIIAAPLVASHAANLTGQELKEFDSRYLRSPAHGPSLRRAEDEIVRRTNDFRYRNDLPDVCTNEDLQKSAEYFAAYLARTNEFGHEADGNHPQDRAALSGYEYCIVAENIAWQMRSTGFSTNELARSFVEGWINSPPHRENMLDPDVTETGVAVAYSSRTNRYYAVQEFGRPKSATLRFEIANRTSETFHYTIESSKRDSDDAQSFDLPPRTTMTHSRCRPTTINWPWTEKDNGQPIKDGHTYIVTKSPQGYEVSHRSKNTREERSSTVR